MKKYLKNTGGLTLISLVITIVILLILAGISISALTNQGLFARAKEAKEKTEQKTAEESATLREYEEQIGVAIGDPNYIAAKTIVEAQTDDMLTKKVNSPIVDAYGNKITVPAGFKIKVDDTTNNATTVDKGIVIIDSNENEFVWIPVGTIYTNAEKTASKTIELGRYDFASDGTPSAYSGSYVEEDSTDIANLKNYGNTIAKNINEFRAKASAAESGGFYIGRYEARTGTARSAKTDALTTLTTKASDYVYNYVTQIQAADLARNMYKDSTKFTSDLMNSYAWDTATLFLQICGTNSKYSRQNTVSGFAATGTNKQTTKDVQCNVYDMASNTTEWTTETYRDSGYACGIRGGIYDISDFYTSLRGNGSTSRSGVGISFRPILYV